MSTILLVEARFYPHLNDMLLSGARRAIEQVVRPQSAVDAPRQRGGRQSTQPPGRNRRAPLIGDRPRVGIHGAGTMVHSEGFGSV